MWTNVLLLVIYDDLYRIFNFKVSPHGHVGAIKSYDRWSARGTTCQSCIVENESRSLHINIQYTICYVHSYACLNYGLDSEKLYLKMENKAKHNLPMTLLSAKHNWGPVGCSFQLVFLLARCLPMRSELHV